MDTTVSSSGEVSTPSRSQADRAMRCVLGLPSDCDKTSITGAENAFSKSVAISAIRCTITYLILPILKPIVDLSGGVGPWLGLVIGTVSMVAIVFSIRRFFAADHRYRWPYAVIGGSILVLLIYQGVADIQTLLR